MTKQTLTPQDTKKIGKLANLTLTIEEVEKFTPQLSDVLSYVAKLQEVNTDNVPETSQVTGLVDVVSEDKTDEKRYVKKGTPFQVGAIFESLDDTQDK